MCALGSTTDTDSDIARLLILAGDPVNASKTTDHMSPLSWAAYHGDLDLLLVLLDPCTGPRANPIWESLPNQAFPIDLAGMRAEVNKYQGITSMNENDQNNDQNTGTNSSNEKNGTTNDEFSSLRLSSPRKKHLGGETIRLNSSPSDCCIHLVQYGVACLGDELKFAQAAGIKINIPSLCRYRTHLLYWAASFGMIKEVKKLMQHREEGLKKMYVVKNNSGNGNEGQEQNIKRPPAEFDIMLPSVEMKLTNLGNGGVDQKKNGNGNLNNGSSPGIAYNSFLLGGAIFSPIDGNDQGTERGDGGGGAVLHTIADKTAAAYDGRMLMGQRIVGINGEDVSTWTFREIVTKCLHRAHRNSIDLEKVMNDDGEDGGNGVNRGNENEEDQIPEGRVVLTMRDPDVWSFQHARDLDLSPVELEGMVYKKFFNIGFQINFY